MKMIKAKRLLSMLAGMAMFVSLIPATVMADTDYPTDVRYVKSDGTYGVRQSYSSVDNSTDSLWESNWYVVKDNDDKKVIFRERIEIVGNVKLILNDTTVLYALDGFHVAPGSTLTIYGQSIDLEDHAGTNLSVSTHSDGSIPSGYAAMGGNAGEKCGDINIVTGRVSVTAGYDDGAGIGTGNYSSRAAYQADTATAGDIMIESAFVTAQGGHNAAGIGGGDYADAPRIGVLGGTVRAIGNGNHQQAKEDDALIGAAGIGGGRGGCLIQYGQTAGNVIAASCGIGSGVGDGYDSPRQNFSNPSLRVYGGTLLAESNWGTSALMGGKDQDMSLFHDSIVSVYDSAKIKYLDIEGWTGDEENIQVTLDISEYKNHNLIHIEPCNHEVHVFVPVEGGHTEKCTTCRTVFSTENHTFDGDGICTACGYTTPVVFTVFPELEGKITLIYAFRISDALKNDANAYVSFTSSGKTWKVKFTPDDYDMSEDAFMIRVPVDAVNLADSIVMNVYNGNNVKQPLFSKSGTDYSANGFSYSVKEYAEHLSSSGYHGDLANALNNYGAMVCNYFKNTYGDWEPNMSELAQVSEENLNQYALSTSGKDSRPACISKTTICVSFDSDNTLRITYYLINDAAVSNLAFTLDDTEYKPKRLSAGVYAIDVENIAAPDLDVFHKFEVTDGSTTYEINACAMSYALTSIKNGDEKRANLGKAFYLYNKAANEYFHS